MAKRKNAKATDKRTRKILRDFLKGLLFAIVMVIAKVGLEHFKVGEELDLFGYRLIQGRLSADKIPLQIVDISGLEPDPVLKVTPRGTLRDLITALADQHPRAIGVDIDFSPPPDQYVYLTPEDYDFIEFCLKLSEEKNISIFLGVQRRLTLPPEVWLGSKDFKKLAAGIIIPEDARWLPLWIQNDETFQPGPGMGAALASTSGETRCEFAELLGKAGLVRKTRERKTGEKGIAVSEFLVDFSPLHRLQEDQRIRTYNKEVIRDQGYLLEDKIVLIGDATLGKAFDTFHLEGQTQPVPGIYFHACAAYTLMTRPLYHLTTGGRLTIDLFLSFVILVVILSIRLYFRQERREVASHRLQGLLTVLVVLCALVVGILFVQKTCVVWTDFLLTLGFLAFHPSLEKRWESIAEKARSFAPPFLRWIIFEDDQRKHK